MTGDNTVSFLYLLTSLTWSIILYSIYMLYSNKFAMFLVAVLKFTFTEKHFFMLLSQSCNFNNQSDPLAVGDQSVQGCCWLRSRYLASILLYVPWTSYNFITIQLHWHRWIFMPLQCSWLYYWMFHNWQVIESTMCLFLVMLLLLLPPSPWQLGKRRWVNLAESFHWFLMPSDTWREK